MKHSAKKTAKESVDEIAAEESAPARQRSEEQSPPPRMLPALDLVGACVATGLLALCALHLFEPAGRTTWSYAHLGRSPIFPWLAVALLGLTPVACAWAWQIPAGGRPMKGGSAPVAAALGMALIACLAGLALLAPTPWLSPDTEIFRRMVEAGDEDYPRWHLLLMSYQAVATPLAEVARPVIVIRLMNAVFSGCALIAVAATARLLAAQRREFWALLALTVTAFGIAQLCIGYSDIYPLPLFILSVYVYLGLGALFGRLHPAWAIGLAGLAPFIYLGLVLLLPSLLVIVTNARKREGGMRAVGVGVVTASLLGGIATVPHFGLPFAWRAFLKAQATDTVATLGRNAEGYQLPWNVLLSADHFREVFHGLLLVDAVGWWLILCIGGAAGIRAARSGRFALADPVAFLALLVAPYLAYVIAMDPLYGAYTDWDLFSYGAVASALLGGVLFVRWGRDRGHLFALLLGLALATNGVHLLARLNGLHLEWERHREESPFNLPGVERWKTRSEGLFRAQPTEEPKKAPGDLRGER